MSAAGTGRTRILFGGTFDPPHEGHVAMARAALAATGAERLVVVPALRSPFKTGFEPAPGADRLAMCRAAFAPVAGAEISTVEIDRTPPSYTIDTLESLRRANPGVAAWWLLVGEDSLNDLPRWHRAAALAASCGFLVAPRRARGDGHPSATFPTGFRLRPVPMDPVDVSASAIRASLAAGRSPAGLPAAVLAVIRERGLYGAGSSGRSSAGRPGREA